MRNVNQDYLLAVGLAQRLMSKDQAEREAAWNLIWRNRIYRRWIEVLCLLVGVLVEKYGVEGAHVAQLLMDNRNDRWWEIILAAQMWYIEQEVDSTQLKKGAIRVDKTSI